MKVTKGVDLKCSHHKKEMVSASEARSLTSNSSVCSAKSGFPGLVGSQDAVPHHGPLWQQLSFPHNCSLQTVKFRHFLIPTVCLHHTFKVFFDKPAACGILVPRLEVGPKLLWWELRVQIAGLIENLRHQGIPIGVRPPGGPHLSTKTQLYPTACKLQCWTSQAKQPVRQEYSTTHQKQTNKKRRQKNM